MKYTHDEVKKAIMFFSKRFKKEHVYTELIKLSSSLPELVKIVVYDMFLYEIEPYYYMDDETGNNYKIILEYAKELKEKGFVN